jgi:hypothetical protein
MSVQRGSWAAHGLLSEDLVMGMNYRVPGLFDVIAQPTSMTCWATTATMMMEWKAQQCFTIDTAMARAGKKWADLFASGGGLMAVDHGPFAHDCGMEYEPLACYPDTTWLTMLKKYGPLAVVTANPFHARIMIGINDTGGGETVKIVDPNGGRIYDLSFDTFTHDFEDVARSPRYQIWHFPSY